MQQKHQVQCKQYIIKGICKTDEPDLYIMKYMNGYPLLSFDVNDAFKFNRNQFMSKNHAIVHLFDAVHWLPLSSCYTQQQAAKKYPLYKADGIYEKGACFVLGKHTIICNPKANYPTKRSLKGKSNNDKRIYRASSFDGLRYINRLIWLRLLDYCKKLKQILPGYDWKPIRWNSKYVEYGVQSK